jgi:DNA polymerase-3 subunit epsilon
MSPMTSSGSGDSPDTSGPDIPASTGSGNRSRRRRRRQVHRRAAPPSPQTVERYNRSGQSGQSGQDTAETAGPAGADHSADHSADVGTTDTSAAPSARQTPPRQAKGQRRNLPRTFHGTLPSVEEAPFVELRLAVSGIHPTTSRMVAFAATLHTADGDRAVFTGNRPACAGDPADDTGTYTGLTGVVQQINPGEDPGPWHLHGYTEADLGQAPGFATVAPLLHELLDGRTLICHGRAHTWGFVLQEFRRAQRAANRNAPRGGNRGRRRAPRRPRKIAVPVPARIIDTRASAHRQSVPVPDVRLRSISAYYATSHDLVLPADALPDIGPTASLERADIPADTLLLADTRLLFPLYREQERLADEGLGILAAVDPGILTADKFGLQRSTVRVEATTSPRPYGNPGVPVSGDGSDGDGSTDRGLVQGMEFVVSPDVAEDPDVLISAGMRAGLAYSEKLNRTSSLVVCNRNQPLRGKAMHGHRKNIPLFTDAEFLAALDDVAAGAPPGDEPDPRPATPRIPAPQKSRGRSGGSNRSDGSGRGNRGGRGSGSGGNRNRRRQGAGKSGTAGKSAKAGTSGPTGTSGGGNATGGDDAGNRNSSRRSGGRRRRRSGGSRRPRQNRSDNQKKG